MRAVVALLCPACALAAVACGARSQLREPLPATSDAGQDVARVLDASFADARDVLDARDAVDGRSVADVVPPDIPSICSTPGVDASVDVNGPDGSICSATLSVQALMGDTFCFLDQMVTGAPGTLRYDCTGGLAEAMFVDHRFVGTYRDGVVDVCLGTQFLYSDNCVWNSAQRITGVLASGTLMFSYHEAPENPRQVCASACSVTADVSVQ